jgi:hypothetical protein
MNRFPFLKRNVVRSLTPGIVAVLAACGDGSGIAGTTPLERSTTSPTGQSQEATGQTGNTDSFSLGRLGKQLPPNAADSAAVAAGMAARGQ